MTDQVKQEVAKDERNGVVRPKADSSTGKVWLIADEISSNKKEPATRREVIEAGVDAGLNASTISTQYGRWRKYHGLAAEPRAPRKAKEAAAEVETGDAEE